MGTTVVRKAAWLVEYDRATKTQRYRRDVDIAFDERGIRAIGAVAEKGEREIDGTSLMVMPGLINVHAHCATASAGKGVIEELGNLNLYGTGLYDSKAPFRITADGYPASEVNALCELMLSGVTTVVDAPFRGFEGWIDIMARSGMRGVIAPAFASATWFSSTGNVLEYKWDEKEGLRQFEAALKIIDAAEKHPSGRLSGMLYPAQVDTCTPELIKESYALAKRTGRVWQTHASQSLAEFQEVTRRHGLTPIQWLASLGVLGPESSVGHAIFIDRNSWTRWHTDRDLAILAETGTSVCHCPTPFMRYGHAMETVGDYLAAGVNMGLGTDCHPHDLVMEMGWAATLGRVMARRHDRITTGQIFDMATRGGARLLKRDDIGGLAVGMKSDLVLVDLNEPAMRPARDPLRSLIYSCGSRAIRDVFIAGMQVVANRKVLTLDHAAALAEIERIQRKVLATAGERWRDKTKTADELAPLSLPLA
ncbi:MAG: amidohydrolase family protein [Alphaproteobacteria bacterium]|nr:amidohydrolase family protein [Alphaproteobacteria bacterium]